MAATLWQPRVRVAKTLSEEVLDLADKRIAEAMDWLRPTAPEGI